MSPEPLTRADVLAASEASRLLGIPRSTLYALARRHELPARQIGRRWVFRRSLLERATLPPLRAGLLGRNLPHLGRESQSRNGSTVARSTL
jgi:excisionase family DNA binding protein